MGAVKWIVVAVFGLASLAMFGLAFSASASIHKSESFIAPNPKISLRPFSGTVAAGTKTTAPTPTPTPVPTNPTAAKTVDAGAPVPVPVGVQAVKVDAGVAPAPVPVPVPVPAKVPGPAPVPAPAGGDTGLMNLRATDTADIFVDGKKVGASPLPGFKSKVGTHKVRFDCYDAAGNAVTGAAQTVTVQAAGEVDVEFQCPASE